MKFKMKPQLTQWILLILLALTWGSSFILMKKALYLNPDTPLFNAYEVAGLRLFIASVALLPVWAYKFRKIKKNFWPLFVVGIIGSGIPSFMFTIAETKITSSLAGMLNATVPIMAALISIIFFKIHILPKKIFGVLIGLIGVAGLIGLDYNAEKASYALLVLIATMGYALSVTTIKYKLFHLNSVEITSLAFSFLLIPASIFLMYQGTFEKVTGAFDTYKYALMYTFILGFFGTAIAVILYSKLVAISEPVFASSVTYLIPIVATFWGVYFGEQVAAYEIIFMLIIIGSVFIIRTKENPAPKK